jgi:predicted dehydrogenase
VTDGLRVGIVGCGLIGRKRAESLRAVDTLVGCMDAVRDVAEALAREHGAVVVTDLDQLLALVPDVVVVATPHDLLAPMTRAALAGGAHVLVEKPGGLGTQQIETLRSAAAASGRLVKVGFNHRFHPALRRVADEIHSGRHGELMHMRARYGHGGRIGYDREWRADPARSGGGELVDQGMHLLDLTHWLAGPLPLHSALLRTHFWDTPADDNAALLLGQADARTAPWAMLHVTWTEWKNTFSLEAYCERAKLQVDGLVRSYGSQILRIYTMKPELGPPDLEEIEYGAEDVSWAAEWEHLVAALAGDVELLGSLDDAHYAWSRVEDAYASSPGYARMREDALA